MRDTYIGKDLDAAIVKGVDGSAVERLRVAVVGPDGMLLASMDQTEILQQLRRIALLLEILTGATVSLNDIT